MHTIYLADDRQYIQAPINRPIFISILPAYLLATHSITKCCCKPIGKLGKLSIPQKRCTLTTHHVTTHHVTTHHVTTHHVIGSYELVDLWVIKMKKAYDPLRT